MPCSYCGERGHNFRTCSKIPYTEREKKIKENKKARDKIKNKETRIDYKIYNKSDTNLVLYYGWNSNDNISFHQIIDIDGVAIISCMKSIHRLFIVPYLDVCHDNTHLPPVKTYAPRNYRGNWQIMFSEDLCNYEGKIIQINDKYKPKKSELEQWKECALKSQYLLNEIIRMGGMNYDNINPILDLVEDVNIPEHDELDKERAGIPSELTNVT